MTYSGHITINMPDETYGVDFERVTLDDLVAEVRRDYPTATSVVIVFTLKGDA